MSSGLVSISNSESFEELIDNSLLIVRLDKALEGSCKLHCEACSVTESLKIIDRRIVKAITVNFRKLAG